MAVGESPLIKTGAPTDGKDKARRAAKFKRASQRARDLLEHYQNNRPPGRVGTVTGGIIVVDGEQTRWQIGRI
jgi:hypothetical protein